MKNFSKVATLFVLIAFGIGCSDSLDFDVDNPNTLTLDTVNPDLLFNSIQYDFRAFETELAANADELIRMRYRSLAYDDIDPSDMNGAWRLFYFNNSNIQVLDEIKETHNAHYHYGASLIMKAAGFLDLADVIGKLAVSEANDHGSFSEPSMEDASVAYEYASSLLEMGIELLSESTGKAPSNDLYADGDNTLWIKYANTLKLKMYLQTRLVDESTAAAEINQLITDDNLIDELQEDFEYKYGSVNTVSDSRHPDYITNYFTATGSYQSNGLMSYMKDSTMTGDPRLSYYFYRQSLFDPLALPCAGDTDYDICYVGEGYHGRDHVDEVVSDPNDATTRTVFGSYPAGGAFDDGATNEPVSEDSADGNGIFPIMLSSWTHFMLAEAALTINTAGDPRSLLASGIQLHMDKVLNSASGNATQSDVDAYINEVLAKYDAASTEDEKLDIIITEWYISSFGNGLLMYNAYRRTGFPSFLQSPVKSLAGFPRSLFLPESEFDNNANVDLVQKNLADQLFWDTNPAEFID